jgi:hypothetical protein
LLEALCFTLVELFLKKLRINFYDFPSHEMEPCKDIPLPEIEDAGYAAGSDMQLKSYFVSATSSTVEGDDFIRQGSRNNDNNDTFTWSRPIGVLDCTMIRP